ncbi:Succinate dehydrogenase [ubiquinone] iron-sulfur subunit, mitochondrial [Sesamum alatum]|uniref:Succinate dehydrogenase [ubiquinone] iron-sulfur subunit, mitochondrial n=1 Tax=Sesamum alatum TaxID=300844 RepID=A0AAE2CD66_9LAMI|nr:Succinate dehydrogenase [ubiquinone] iron-sulfur subunit, mitochondrial [Sesamum alatum]
MFVVKDLVVDMTNFYNQYKSIEQWLKRKNPPSTASRRFCRARRIGRSLMGCMNVLCVPAVALPAPATGAYLGPAALLHANRWIMDSRDEYTKERLDAINDDIQAVSLPYYFELC